MTEGYKPNIQQEAIGIVRKLTEVADNHERVYPAEIDAVLVFSGPGTYYDRLKPGQPEWMAWMDRDRIRGGVAVVREVTASWMRKEGIDQNKIGHDVSYTEIEEYGPLLVYNGIPVENEVFRRAVASEHSKIPLSNVVVLDEVIEENGDAHPIRHTGDQYKSFFHEVQNAESPLFGVKNVALVAHIPDFVRHPYYAERYNRELREAMGEELTFWAYGIRSREGSIFPHMRSELPRLVAYSAKGDLSTVPAPLNT
jgi:hypothetical protein